METLKKGSTGKAVERLQRKLGVTVDGIYGKDTESAVKKYQAEHGLAVDGIAGLNTLGILGLIDVTSSKAVDECVTYKPLPVHVTASKDRPVKYLVIHFTGSSNSRQGRALGTFNTFMKKNASADFCVDDADIVQFNPDIRNYYCWAVGGTKYHNNGGKLYGKAVNKNVVSIEICSTCVPSTKDAVGEENHTGWSFSEAALNNAVKLARILMKLFDIPIGNVIRHYDVTGKLCPGLIGWNDEKIYDLSSRKSTGKNSDSTKWEAFKKRLTENK